MLRDATGCYASRVSDERRDDGDRLLTVEQVAEQLQVTTETVRRWLRAGELQGVRLPARNAGWRISRKALNEWLDAHTPALTGKLPPAGAGEDEDGTSE